MGDIEKMLFFTYDEDDNTFMVFETEADALEHATKTVEDYPLNYDRNNSDAVVYYGRVYAQLSSKATIVRENL